MGYRYAQDVFDDEEQLSSNFVVRHWRGQLSLPASWFLVGGLLSTVLVSVLAALLSVVESNAPSLRLIAAASIGFLLLFLILRVWTIVGIWRSAGRHVALGGSENWASLARGLLILGVLASLFQAGSFGEQALEYGKLAFGSDSLGAPANLSLSPSGQELTLEGALSSGTAAEFADLVKSAPNLKTVNLQSPGGRIWEAQRIAKIIKEQGLETHVEKDCESACTFILLAGRERWIAPFARVGFHQPSFPGFTPEQQQAAIAAQARDYVAAGMDQTFVDRINATPPESMWFPSHQELVDAGVTSGTEVVVGGSDKSDRLAKELSAAAEQINRAGNLQIDKITKRTGAVANGRTLTINNQIAGNFTAGQLRQGSEQMRPGIVASICKDPAAEALIAAGATITVNYDSGRGSHLFSVPVKRCN